MRRAARLTAWILIALPISLANTPSIILTILDPRPCKVYPLIPIPEPPL